MQTAARRTSANPSLLKQRSSTAIATAVASLALASFGGGTANAQSLYFDANGSTSGLGGTGSWTAAAGSGNWNAATGTGARLDWVNFADAFFAGTSGKVTVNSPITASSLNFSVGGYEFVNGAGSPTLTLDTSSAPGPSINMAAGGTTKIDGPVSATKTVYITGVTSPTLNFYSANTFAGGLDIHDTMRVNFNVDGAAGNGGNSAATITVHASGTRLSNENTVNGGTTPGAVTLNVAQNVLLNPDGIGGFQTAMGATTAVGTNRSLTLNWVGKISGNSDVFLGNAVGNGGGASITMFSNAGNDYTGKTYVVSTGGNSFGAFQLGNDNVLPRKTDLIFGNLITNKVIGMMDLNGHNVEVASVSTLFTDPGTGIGVVGASGDGISNTSSSVKTLTISGIGAGYAGTNVLYEAPIGAVTNGSGGSGLIGTNNVAINYKSDATWQLARPNTYTGGTTISNGAIQLVQTGSLSAAGALTVNGGSFDLNGHSQQVTGFSGTGGSIIASGGAATFTPNVAASITNSFAGSIQDGGSTLSVTKTGAGKLVLTGSNSFSGPTAVNAGTLTVDGSLSGTSSVAVATNATLAGNGTIAGPVSISSGGSLSAGDPSGKLTLSSSLTLSPNAALHFGLGGGSNSSISVGGLLTLPDGAATTLPVPIDVGSLGTIAPGTYSLLSYTGGRAGDFGHLILRSLPAGFAYSLDDNAGSIDLVVNTLGTNKTWTGTGGGTWSTSIASWTPGNYADASPVTFGDGVTNTTINIPNIVKPGPITFTNSIPYTIGGAAIAGQTTLTLNGTGTVTLSNANTFSGTVAINSGILAVASDAPLGNLFNSMVIGTSGTLRATGSFASNRVFTLSGTASGIDVTGANNLTLTGILGGTGGLAKTGTGALTLSNAGNSYQGATAINQGTLTIGMNESIPDASAVSIASGALLNLGTNVETIGSLSGAGNVVLGAGAVLSSGGNSGFTTFSGAISGAGTLTKLGTGTLTLTGTSSTFGGAGKTITIGGGTLSVAGDSNLGALANTVTIADGATLGIDTTAAAFNSARNLTLIGGATGATIDVAGANGATIVGIIDSGNGLRKTGAGTLTLSNVSNAFTSLSIVGGTVATATDAALGTGSISFSNGGALKTTASFSTAKTLTSGFSGGTIDTGANTLTVTGLFAGVQNTGITKTGTGTLILATGGSAYAGAWNITQGTVVVNAVDVNNVGGVGVGGSTSGQLSGNSIKPSGTGVFQIDGVALGKATSSNRAPRIYFENGGTVIGTTSNGVDASYGYDGGGVYVFRSTSAATPVIANVGTKNAGDTFTIQNEISQTSRATDSSTFSGVSNATINVIGAGRVVLQGGTTHGNSTYAGSWNVQSGTLQLGPVTADTDVPLSPGARPYGEPLNALGFVDGDPEQANPVSLTGGTLAIGVDAPNLNPNWTSTSDGTPIDPTPNFLRNPITLSGGAVASTGYEVSYDITDPTDAQGVPTSTPITAQLGGNLTVAAGTTSRVLTYDPVDPAKPARTVQLVGGSRLIASQGVTKTYATNWAGTLVVDPGTSTGGSFDVLRDAGTVAVTSGASIHVLQGATLKVGGALDSLTDGTNFVNIANDSTATGLAVLPSSGTHRVGTISGSGTTTVGTGSTLSAVAIAQSVLNVNGSAVLRSSATAIASSVGTLSIGGAFNSWTGKLDLANNKLTIASADLATIANQVINGYAGGTWSGNGITSSSTDARHAVGYAPAGGSGAIVRLTVNGDSNCDGTVNFDDLLALAKHYAASTSRWDFGDFTYDGTVNFNDLLVLAKNYGSASAAGEASLPGSFQADWALAQSMVPEPTSLLSVALAGVVTLSRRCQRDARA